MAEKREIYNPQLEVVHKVVVKGAKVVESKFGDTQLQLWLSFIDSNGTEIGRRTVWESLPNQESDSSIPADKAQQRNEMRLNMLKALYAAAQPEDYTTFAKKKGKKFLDPKGVELTPAEMATKKVTITKQLLAKTRELKTMVNGTDIAELMETSLYAVFKPNLRNDKYPYISLNHIHHQNFESAAYEAVSEVA